MSKKINLQIGEHYFFAENEACAGLLKGSIDVYAMSGDHAQRLFLTSVTEGKTVFALHDEFHTVQIFLMVEQEAELEIFSEAELQEILAGSGEKQMRQAMHDWLLSLLELEWVNYFAVRNDDFVGQWQDGRFLFDLPGTEVWGAFIEHQNIFSLLCNGQLNSQRQFFSQRLVNRQKNKLRMMSEAVEELTGKQPSWQLSSAKDASQADLAMLVGKARQFFKMEPLEIKLTNLSNDGSDKDEVSCLKYMLGKAGLRFRRVLLENGWSVNDSGLFFVKYQNQLALALPESPSRYTLLRQNGERLPLDEAHLAQISPAAWQIYGGMPNRAMTKKDLYLYVIKQCWRQDYTNILLVSVILGLIPLLTPIITETVFSDVVPVHDYRGLSTITQVMLIAGFATAMLTLVRSLAVTRITGRIDMDCNAALWSRVLSLPTEFFKKFSVGEMVKRIQSFEQVKVLITGQFVSGIFNSVFSLWSLCLMCYYSLKLTMMCLFIWACYLGIAMLVHRNNLNYNRERIKAGNATSAQVVQIFNGLTKFRSRGGEEQAFLLWTKRFRKEWDAIFKLRWQNNYDVLLNTILPYIFMLVIYYNVGNWLIKADESAITSTDYLAFNAAYATFSAALMATVPLIVQFFQIPAYVENLLPLLDEVPEASDIRMEAGRLQGEVELKHISFNYSDGPEIIHDVSLHISPGEKVALVGPSGSGKSTLLRIILGFENASRGQVLFDHQDLRDLNLSSVRRQLGVVLQDGKLMTGRIMDNIIAANNLTIDDAWEAARLVGIDKDIEEMPMGMHTMINEGSSNISGGQRQRILLARSIAHKPAILLLDEATSALDNTTQNIVANSLEKMHCTQIIVAHRLSTIRNADKIVVLEDGRITETGTYDELMALQGTFTKLAARQLA